MAKIMKTILPSLLLPFVTGQMHGGDTVGPLTNSWHKAHINVCDVTSYAGYSSDVGPAIVAAWNDCIDGGVIWIPPGTFPLKTQVTITGGSGIAIQWDGTLYRAGTDYDGHMMWISDSSDIEIFSGNSKGAFQGYGYQYYENGEYGDRFLRLVNLKNWSLHGIAFVDSPSYYIVIDDCRYGEVYNLILRGVSTVGANDGIDVSGYNIWIHDVEVTNGDECVTVKTGSDAFTIERIHCNLSGGTAIGSLGKGTSVTNIRYYNLYMNNADACYIKTHNGNGLVNNIEWANVIVHGGAYVLAVNEAWGDDLGSTGVQISNLIFKDWHGYNNDHDRPTIRIECDPDVPCYGITVDNVNLWTEDGSNHVYWSCQNAYGSGACLKSEPSNGDFTAYTSYSTITATLAYSASTMPNDLLSAFPSTKSFTIPPVPTTFYPGLNPYSALLSLTTPGGVTKRAVHLPAMAFPTPF